jgi:hypothetical protein
MYETSCTPHPLCNLLYVVYKESLLCSLGSAFGYESTQLLLASLINLLPKRFGSLSVSV